MKLRLILPLLLLSVPVAFAHDASHVHEHSGPALNKDGSVVTGVVSPLFNPSAGLLPFPHNLLFTQTTGTPDLTLNVPGTSDLVQSLSSLDGFSTTEKWTVSFVDNVGAPKNIDPASVVPGKSVRIFQVTAKSFLFVTGVVRELTFGVDFVTAVANGNVLAIIWLKPLPEYSNFMVVLTNDIRDMAGNDATPTQTYHLTKRTTPWVDANGKSTYALLPDATARAVEPLRQMTQTMEGAAAAMGMKRDDIVLSYTVQTQSITPTLKALRSIAQPAPVMAAPAGITTAQVGGFGLADIVIGVITVPYYGGIRSAENPIAPLTDYWKAAPGGYIPPYDQLGLDPTSTNLTFANPFPVVTGMQTVPFIMTVPNANSNFTKRPEGWPVVIYQHGITRNRTDMLRLADAVASAGYAMIAMDQPLHGVVPDVAPNLAPFYIENTPFGPIANERTFDADYWNNATGAPGPDGIMDASGTSTFNLANFRAVLGNLRQAEADMSILALSLQNISVDGDATPDLNPFNVAVVGHSLGVYVSVPFLAVEPIVSRAYLNAGPGQGLRTIEAGFFGIQIRAALASLGILPGSASFEQFMIVGQTVLDSADSINWAAEAGMKMPILHNQVVNDSVVPNTVPGAPLAGNEGLNRILGLKSYSTTQVNPEGLKSVARFLPPASHGSFIDPTTSLAATAEMQGQMATFIGSGGTFVNVGNPDLLVPVVQLAPEITELPFTGKKSKDRDSSAKPGERNKLELFKQPGRAGGRRE